MFGVFHRLFEITELRQKILFTLFALFVYRLVAHISVPGVNLDAVRQLLEQSQTLAAFSLLTGGQLQNFSVVLMGLAPYISAVIIIQLLTVIVPKLEALSKEGEQGRRTLNKYTRWLTVPLALLQSYGMILMMNQKMPVIPNIADWTVLVPVILSVTAGTMFLVWLGDLITESGIGNGSSLIIMTGIVATLPSLMISGLSLASGDSKMYIVLGALALITLLLTVFIVIVSEAQRRIPLSYAGRAGMGAPTFFPLRINQAGMIPVIFATQMIMFPSVLASFFVHAQTPWIAQTAQAILSQTQVTSQTSVVYIFLLFAFTFFFTYFYVSIVFKSQEVAETLQKRGAYITGVRPGEETAHFLETVSNRLNFSGGLFLSFVVTFPLLLSLLFSELQFGTIPFLVSGTSLIIIVGVVLDLIRRINAYLVMNDYEKL